jgi:hypothetical protein
MGCDALEANEARRARAADPSHSQTEVYAMSAADKLDRLQRQLAPRSTDVVGALTEALPRIRSELREAMNRDDEFSRGYAKGMRDVLKILNPTTQAHERWLQWARDVATNWPADHDAPANAAELEELARILTAVGNATAAEA